MSENGQIQAMLEFLKHVTSLSSETHNSMGDGYNIEFSQHKDMSANIKTNEKFDISLGSKLINKKKNRYKDIIPFEHRRVNLLEIDGEESSNYINASYIADPSNKLTYIAAQGPLATTLNDFWRMIWYHRVTAIIMACKEFELGRPKCEKYWVDPGQVQQFGSITVTHISEQNISADFLIRTLQVQVGDEEQFVNHLYYTGWPDHGVPSDVNPIVRIIEKLRGLVSTETEAPIVIHCSAGCGRTGTLIGLDYINTLINNNKFNSPQAVFNLVKDMRLQRPSMVQTKDQYVLLYKTVFELVRRYLSQIKSDDHTLKESIQMHLNNVFIPAFQNPSGVDEISEDHSEFGIPNTEFVSANNQISPLQPKLSNPQKPKKPVGYTPTSNLNKPQLPKKPFPAKQDNNGSISPNLNRPTAPTVNADRMPQPLLTENPTDTQLPPIPPAKISISSLAKSEKFPPLELKLSIKSPPPIPKNHPSETRVPLEAKLSSNNAISSLDPQSSITNIFSQASVDPQSSDSEDDYWNPDPNIPSASPLVVKQRDTLTPRLNDQEYDLTISKHPQETSPTTTNAISSIKQNYDSDDDLDLDAPPVPVKALPEKELLVSQSSIGSLESHSPTPTITHSTVLPQDAHRSKSMYSRDSYIPMLSCSTHRPAYMDDLSPQDSSIGVYDTLDTNNIASSRPDSFIPSQPQSPTPGSTTSSSNLLSNTWSQTKGIMQGFSAASIKLPKTGGLFRNKSLNTSSPATRPNIPTSGETVVVINDKTRLDFGDLDEIVFPKRVGKPVGARPLPNYWKKYSANVL